MQTETHCTRCGDPTFESTHLLQHGIPGVWQRTACKYPHALFRATHGDPTPPALTDEQADAIRRQVS